MELRNLAVVLATSEEARNRDRLAIESGISSQALMQAAGEAAAARIVHHYRGILSDGVEIRTGPGNNGGDGRIVAAELAKGGITVHVIEAQSPQPHTRAAVVVDALLGTGSKGPPRRAIAESVAETNRAKDQGAKIVALDIPTGLDATTGEAHDPVMADLTLSFGTFKRGQLISRGFCGAIEVLDIGLGRFGTGAGADITVASPDWVSSHLPRLEFNAHKGTRKRLVILAGDVGMAGAAILAGRGALRSGIGLVHLIVASENRDAVHAAIPAAIVSTHEEFIQEPAAAVSGADAVVIGPGLKPETAARILGAFPSSGIPVVLDAGALISVEVLRGTCGGREAVLTPHPAEMGRITEMSTADVLAKRFDVGAELAHKTGATVLLKGTPTIVSHPTRARIASATGTAALGTGGSGDILSGMIGTLIAQSGSGFESAACAAWVHGRAAELCGSARGVTLDDILYAMPAAWRVTASRTASPVLASLPSVQ